VAGRNHLLSIDLAFARAETQRYAEGSSAGRALYPAIQIGQILLPTLGIAISVGIFAALLLALGRASECGLTRATVSVAAVGAVIAGIFGARATDHLLQGLLGEEVPCAGLAAGLALAALAVKDCSFIAGVRFSVLADYFSQPIALALAIVHFGCFLAGCSYGQPTDRPWGVVFNNALALAWYRTPIGVKLHPTQLYECFLALVLIGLLKLIARNKPADGVQILVLIAAYAFGRFFIEFIRGDAGRGLVGPLSIPQWFCVLALFSSVILLTRRFRQNTQAAR